MTSFILSLAYLATGFLGITGLLPIYKTYPVLANTGAILLGILGLLILIYAGRSGETAQQRKEHSRQRAENVQLRKETSDQSKREREQLKEEIDQLKKENEQQRNNRYTKL
jgi:cell shape-determining protein MreC